MSSNEPPKTHPMLATELLGFQPQLLLDELMSAVNETIYESTARVEEFLNEWIDEKERAGEDVEPLKKELEHGMHALQTLLENYADLAFDFFEAWSHRNIFVIDEGLPIVAPHQRGLDLEVPLERERELQIEVETLRRKLDNMRRQYAKIRRCEAQAAVSRRKAEALLKSISFIEPAVLESEKATKPLADFLAALRKLYDIPRPEPSAATGTSMRPTAGKEAYLSWAVDRLMKDADGDKFASRAEEEVRQLMASDDMALGTSSPPRVPVKVDEDTDDSLSDSMTSQG